MAATFSPSKINGAKSDGFHEAFLSLNGERSLEVGAKFVMSRECAVTSEWPFSVSSPLINALH